MLLGRSAFPALLAAAATLLGASSAFATTRTVDDDKAQCPGATYSSIQTAIDAASDGDVISVCPGTYVEGSGGPNTNALTIANLSIDIRGAGADLVVIQPKRSTPTGGQIADPALDLRNGLGDIVSITGTTAFPVIVNLSGLTVDGNGVYVEGGVVYRDGGGTVSRSRVTNIVTSEADTAAALDGGYRSSFPGVGIAQVTAGTGTPALTRPPLNVVQSRISRYNRVGVLIDSATNDTPPLVASTVVNTAQLDGDQIVGRTQCSAFNTPSPPPYVLGGAGATPTLQLPGNCTAVSLTTTGATFGQDGVRVTAGSTVAITGTTITGNLVHGTGAPTYNSATNNANLPLGAGVRLLGAGASSIQDSNVTDNAYGAYNAQLDGSTANTAVPLNAENVFWGLRTNATLNPGPAVSPATNPPYLENPVNGTATVDATCLSSAGTAIPGSNAVDFCPFRNGNQGDPNLGELPVAYAPLPVPDEGPSVTLTTSAATLQRGDTVTLTAPSTDDFGVTKVTFYDGANQVATAIPPAAAASYLIPADAACAAHTLTAVAEDSAGQTASDTKTITVVEAHNCVPQPDPTPVPPDPTPVPPPPAPALPTVALTGVPATVPEAGATIGAAATADATLTLGAVDFRLGTRSVCVDAQPPYSCALLPNGGEVGKQALQAVAVDSAGRSAVASASTTVAKFTTKAIRIKVKSTKRKKRLVRALTGTLSFNPRVTKRQGCATGTVTLTVLRNGRKLIGLEQVPLKRDCTFALRFTVAASAKHAFKATASFGGNAVLKAVKTTKRFS